MGIGLYYLGFRAYDSTPMIQKPIVALHQRFSDVFMTHVGDRGKT